MKKKNIIFILFLFIIVFGIYWRTFNYELIWDSKIYINEQNIIFRDNYPISSAFKFGYYYEQLGEKDVDFYYRPLLTGSFMIENKLWGLKKANLRITNLLIYTLSLIFLYIFLKYQSEKNLFPEVVTLLFALYPLNVDNIVWVVGRSDLLLLLWGILTFLFLELSVKKGKCYFLIFSSLFYLFGLLSKEAFLFFLPVLFLYEIIKRKKIFIFYHLSNILISISFFILKNKILGIKNLGLDLSPNILENIKIGIASLGYYFRSIVFPIYYDMFLPLKDVTNLSYYLLGILTVLIIFFLSYKSKKYSEIIIPLSLIIVFIGGHLLLLFTSLYPFKLYARYMMIPALGFIWIFVIWIGRLKEKIRLSLVFIIILLFIPSIILNSQSYKSELRFFQRANKSSPENSYILFQIAKAFHEQNDYLEAELALNETLSYRQKKMTAIHVGLLYADIEFRKADYEKVSRWLESIENLVSSPPVRVVPFIEYQIGWKKALMYLYQGNVDSAEKLLKEMIKRNEDRNELYKELYQMYIGHNMWEKAEDLKVILKKRFPFFKSIDEIPTEREFNALSLDEKIGFFILYRNFKNARDIINSRSPLDLTHKILLSKLYYWEGKEELAKSKMNEILSEYPDDFKVLNTIGNFYLKDLLRVKEAVFYFKKSLEINKNQPEIADLVERLTENYLKKLKNIWPNVS